MCLPCTYNGICAGRVLIIGYVLAMYLIYGQCRPCTLSMTCASCICAVKLYCMNYNKQAHEIFCMYPICIKSLNIIRKCLMAWTDPEAGQGFWTPPPPKNHRNIGFLKKTGPDPL